jgi:hypothetical protein
LGKTMSKNKPPSAVPVVLDLAILPREQVGPFLLLGVDKTADKEQVEAAWAQRIIWARKGLIKTPLEDVNWAREAMSDFDKRVRADAASLNLDTSDGVLRNLRERFNGKGSGENLGKPLDDELDLADYAPAVSVPEIAEERRAVPVPEVPGDIPAVKKLLEDLVRETIDRWNLPGEW